MGAHKQAHDLWKAPNEPSLHAQAAHMRTFDVSLLSRTLNRKTQRMSGLRITVSWGWHSIQKPPV